MKTISLFLYVFVLFLASTINVSFAKDSCLEIPKDNMKVEAWLSKKYKDNSLDILKDFKERRVSKIGLFTIPRR